MSNKDERVDTGSDPVKCEDLPRTTLTDFHRNIFYYYRGGPLSDDQRERQLENNTTKALINTLQHCDRGVCQEFLTQVLNRANPDSDSPRIWDLSTNPEFRFDLQQKLPTEGLTGKPNRLLLALVPRKNQEAGQDSSTTELDSRPDAWIYGDDFAILIESKVAGGLNDDQMEGHRRILSPDGVKPKNAKMTWAEVFACFSNMQKNLNGRDHWLVGQFIQFLEWSRMAGFTGFKKEFFDYFRNPGDEEVRKWVRESMKDFGERVVKKSNDPRYPIYKLGNIQSDHCWVAFGKQEFKKQAHLTVAINANGVDVFVNVETQPATKKLKERIKDDLAGFKKCVLELVNPGPFTVKLGEMKPQLGKNEKPLPKKFYTIPVTSIRSADLLDESTRDLGFNYFAALFPKIKKVDFTLVRTIPRKEILGEEFQKDSGDALINEVLGIMRSLDDLVRFIND